MLCSIKFSCPFVGWVPLTCARSMMQEWLVLSVSNTKFPACGSSQESWHTGTVSASWPLSLFAFFFLWNCLNNGLFSSYNCSAVSFYFLQTAILENHNLSFKMLQWRYIIPYSLHLFSNYLFRNKYLQYSWSQMSHYNNISYSWVFDPVHFTLWM